jgi:hypothetical protein
MLWNSAFVQVAAGGHESTNLEGKGSMANGARVNVIAED